MDSPEKVLEMAEYLQNPLAVQQGIFYKVRSYLTSN